MTKEELKQEAEENSFRYTLDKPWTCEVERKQIMAHFEKDAEEYAEGMAKYYESVHGSIPSQFEKYLRKAVEFGWNKSNEWHYPSKGEYPKECEKVWCYCKGMGIKFCCIGHTIVGGDNKVRWWGNDKPEKLRVIAWKEIILPKESKQND